MLVVDDLAHEPAVRMVERVEIAWPVGVAVERAEVARIRGVHVRPLGEDAPVGCQSLVGGPTPTRPRLTLTRDDPVRREVLAVLDGLRDRRDGRTASLLVGHGGDPTSATEQVGIRHRARDEVVVLVPPVVRALVADVRLHQRDQRGAQPRRVRADPG
jgi:hypothetical protein